MKKVYIYLFSLSIMSIANAQDTENYRNGGTFLWRRTATQTQTALAMLEPVLKTNLQKAIESDISKLENRCNADGGKLSYDAPFIKCEFGNNGVMDTVTCNAYAETFCNRSNDNSSGGNFLWRRTPTETQTGLRAMEDSLRIILQNKLKNSISNLENRCNADGGRLSYEGPFINCEPGNNGVMETSTCNAYAQTVCLKAR